MNRFFLSALVLASAVFSCSAVETKFWDQGDQSDFEKGALHQLSLRSDGRLFLAPETRQLFDSATPYLWAVTTDSHGVIYAGGGGGGADMSKLFTIDAGGKNKVLAQLPGLEIHAIAVDAHDQVYAATDPDGKVYKIGRDGNPQLFYDPHAKYIWALAIDKTGNLYIATGDQGEVHRVSPDGRGSVFFKTDETHARSLAMDAQGNLIVGTEPGGLIIRVTPAGQGFVLYQAPKREITSVAVTKDGTIYASAVGNKVSSAPVITTPSPTPSVTATPTTGAGITVTLAPAAQAPATLPASLTPPATAAVAGGSEVYRIQPDGEPRKVWSNSQDLVYAISFDAQGRPLFGTGNRGRIYRLDSDVLSTQLLDVSPTQVTGFAMGKQGTLYAITGNIGEVLQIGPGLATSGDYESDVLDAGSFSYWGRLAFHGSPAKLAVSTRTGNLNRPQANWSNWAPIQLDSAGTPNCAMCGGGRITSPSARFLQYKVELRGNSPELSGVEIAYLPKNVAPLVEEVEVSPPNYKFPAPAATSGFSGPPASITLPALGSRRSSSSLPTESSTSQTLTYSKGWIGVRWAARDDNGDSLLYDIEIRGVNESDWKPLKDKVREKYYSWDSTAFPDGEYVVRVTASDSPSNPPAEALTSFLVSDPFLIDNTPPQIVALRGASANRRLDITWKARDALSNIDKAEYSLNGGEWLRVEPATRLADAPEADYHLTIDRNGPGEQVVAVRVEDEFGNQCTDKVVIR